jgi:hypothetical protein
MCRRLIVLKRAWFLALAEDVDQSECLDRCNLDRPAGGFVAEVPTPWKLRTLMRRGN